jgi:hypothetical protein
VAVTYIGEDPAGRTAQNNKGARTYQRRFRLDASSQADGPFAVGSNASLPVIGNVHPEDPNAFCISLTVENTNPWKGWTVTANYSDERTIDDTPTDDAASISWNSEQFQKPAVFDLSGNLIVNSAGDPFDPPAMMDDSRRVVTVEKNLAVVPTWILDYQDAVNNDTFSVDGVSIAIGKAKMQAVTVGPRQRRNGTIFRTVTFTIHLQRDGWLLDILDAGFRRKISGGRENIKNNGDGEAPTAPVPLDGNGQPIDDPTPTNCVFLQFPVYKTRAFSSLPLA